MNEAHELLRRAAERFAYDESSPSCLVWKVNSGCGKIGKPAGSVGSNGRYFSVQAEVGKSARVHHVVWYLFNGVAPKMIDHINGNGLDNRIENLREANYSQNNWNRNLKTTSKSGVKNVYYLEKLNAYRVAIWKGNKNIHIGYFKDLDKAINAAEKAREEHHGEYVRR